MQTDLKSDAFCEYNQAASSFFWTMQPGQYYNTYVYGEVGVPAAGGTAGSYMRKEVVDIDSFLSGRNNAASKCTPPAPSLADLDTPPMKEQNLNPSFLIPMYTKELRSSADISSIDLNRWVPLYSDPQNLRHVIEDVSAVRGGLNTQNYVKSAWNPAVQNGIANKPIQTVPKVEKFGNVSDAAGSAKLLDEPRNNFSIAVNPGIKGSDNIFDSFDYDAHKYVKLNNEAPKDQKIESDVYDGPALCMTTLDPSRVCNGCEGITGYPGQYPVSFNEGPYVGQTPFVKALPRQGLPNEKSYPFRDITSQQVVAVGAAPCGPNYFFGDKYQYGTCPEQKSQFNYLG